ncbi:hypothetical protein [Segniliparus rugosus]|uniref:PPE family protein n=1 Tax=Segniliparus rugosus (strain ATCC BAA-974 / DSM 45345 / CCUG 50838 / CIP 108380 / JCM 13579 / CDC 945) TaxID=679197 RepID=E5XTU1_SEGRC|nr:hypothetical protein [Segniliparus rugosus]EFV12221.1 hypothetical protein HMPREF9336_02913 [Segniliparus rugosus ATCC BAA-974]
MSFTDILHWDLGPAEAGAEALSRRADGLAQYADAVLRAPGLADWTGSASGQARALASAHAHDSEQIAEQARRLVAPLSAYVASGQALKAEAHSLVAEAAAHGFEVQPDGSVRETRQQHGLYAKAVARQLAGKAAQILAKDDQLQRSFAAAVRSACDEGASA